MPKFFILAFSRLKIAIFINMWSSRFYFWNTVPLYLNQRKETIKEISRRFPFNFLKPLDKICCIKVLPIFQKVQKDPQKRLQGHFMKEEYGSPQPWGSKSPIGEQSVLMAGVARLFTFNVKTLAIHVWTRFFSARRQSSIPTCLPTYYYTLSYLLMTHWYG